MRGMGALPTRSDLRDLEDRLAERLTDWDDRDVAAFAQLVTKFNDGAGRP